MSHFLWAISFYSIKQALNQSINLFLYSTFHSRVTPIYKGLWYIITSLGENTVTNEAIWFLKMHLVNWMTRRAKRSNEEHWILTFLLKIKAQAIAKGEYRHFPFPVVLLAWTVFCAAPTKTCQCYFFSFCSPCLGCHPCLFFCILSGLLLLIRWMLIAVSNPDSSQSSSGAQDQTSLSLFLQPPQLFLSPIPIYVSSSFFQDCEIRGKQTTRETRQLLI